MADIYQFKFIGAGGNTVYIDNLYFYDDDPAPDTEAPQNFSATVSTITYNSIKLLLNATDNSGAVSYAISVDGTTTNLGAASGFEKSYEFTRLPSSTEFTFSISVQDASGNQAANSPIQLVTSTAEAFPAPLVSSPTPPERAIDDVISIFSDAYTNIPNTNFNPYWQQNTWFYSEQVGGNEVVKYENFNYQGIEIGSSVNASEMHFLHLDVWTPNETSLSIAPISLSTGEKAVQLTPLNLNQWNSFDIPLTNFTIQGLSLTDIFQLKFVGSGKSIVYFDNIYFHKGTPTSTEDINSIDAIKYYPNPTAGTLNILSASAIRAVEVSNLAGQLMQSYVVGGFNSAVDLSAVNSGYYIISVTLENGKQYTQKILKL
ncbi:Por secretion system C-terminal sorting domain-containing protein [Saccharicrinis carchari]|uniref:Por secretion system C-terminal sorting domain-containing protein n=1 Tax=Saccharicrinis carchari TaxID=1168039 RepID=A0A521B0Y0_SACCC|nr:T9SS type A sorting domain-containing protein [Saccharicrinis carchari]SMO40709.1 Por secretion system C-terminal sorting domain-containing protein [Saccharicrinis carchari]